MIQTEHIAVADVTGDGAPELVTIGDGAVEALGLAAP